MTKQKGSLDVRGFHYSWAVAIALVAGSAHAAADTPMIIADARPIAAPRFISLDSARGAQPIARVVTAAPRTTQAMRSDRAALQGGFMRIDSARAQIVRVPKRVAVTKPEPAVVLKESDQQVLDLFGDADAPVTVAPAYGRVSHAWPLPAKVSQKFTSGYGARKDPFTGKAGFHGGVDLACAVGTDVLASADGTVTKVESGSRFGKYVSVKHRDGTESSYGHLSAQSVHVGQQVRQGQKLGEVGSTGRSTGAHLDYRITKGGKLFNPMTVLKAPAVTGISVASNSVAAPARPMNRINHVSTINGVKIIR